MKTRMLAALLALPLVAFDCGPREDVDPFGLGCRMHLAGAVPPEDLWCIMTAYDYSALDPMYASSDWVFEIVAYRGAFPYAIPEVGASVGFFLEGPPTLNAPYGWNGNAASAALRSGGADRYGAGQVHTHSAWSLGAGFSGDGALSATFTRIPPPNAVDAELLGVHGTVTAELPSLGGGDPATLTASF